MSDLRVSVFARSSLPMWLALTTAALLVVVLPGSWSVVSAQESSAQEEAARETDSSSETDGAASGPELTEEEFEEQAQIRDDDRRIRSDRKVSIGSSVRVAEGEIANDVFSLGGRVTVDGEVRGNAVAVGGTVRVRGRVTGNVVAVGGNVELSPEAEVLGDVTSVGGEVEAPDGARIGGEVAEVSLGSNFNLAFEDMFDGFSTDWFQARRSWRALELFWAFMMTAVLIGFASLAGLLFPRHHARVEGVVRRDFIKAAVVGVISQILFLPALVVLTVVLAVSIIGIPLLLLLPVGLLVLALVSVLGYAAVASSIGGAIKRRFGLTAVGTLVLITIGTLAIQAVALFAEFLGFVGAPFLIAVLFGLTGFVIRYVAWTAGFGALLLSGFGTRGAPAPPE